MDRDRGLRLLDATNGSVKLALLMAAADLSRSDAEQVLADHSNRLRAALEACGASLQT